MAFQKYDKKFQYNVLKEGQDVKDITSCQYRHFELQEQVRSQEMEGS